MGQQNWAQLLSCLMTFVMLLHGFLFYKKKIIQVSSHYLCCLHRRQGLSSAICFFPPRPETSGQAEVLAESVGLAQRGGSLTQLAETIGNGTSQISSPTGASGTCKHI